MSQKNKSLMIAISCYLLWGILPAYWNLLDGVSPLIILCARIIFAFVFMIALLAMTGRINVFIATLKDRQKMKYLIPATVFITLNWGLFIYAVNTGQIMYSSLGYYMNPLMAFLLGVVFFREKYTVLQLVAVGLAFAGLLVSILAYGRLPLISISLAFSFAIYGVLKKLAKADPDSSIAVESLLATPFAIAFALIFMTESIRTVSTPEILLLIGGGAATAIPLVLYARAVNGIPFTIVGFLQYISPSLSLIYGLAVGIRPTESQLVSFAFIGLGLVVFSISLVKRGKKESGL